MNNTVKNKAQVNDIYEGVVVRIMEYGAFINILPGKDGLVHISQIADRRIASVNDVLSEGDKVKVKVLEIDRQGRIRLTMRGIDSSESDEAEDATDSAGDSGGESGGE